MKATPSTSLSFLAAFYWLKALKAKKPHKSMPTPSTEENEKMWLFGLPSLPPEVMALLANPKAMGEQIKAFYVAATGLLAAIEKQKTSLAALIETDDVSDEDKGVFAAADAFRAELSKLPPLDQVTK